MSSTLPRNPWLDLPLHGVRLIEASAGTGKTFTLATLVTRLVVEGGLRIGEILAVTFTEAATQELRKRIRERLHLAAALLDAPAAEDESTQAALTRQLLQAHLARGLEDADSLRRRLRQAAMDMDLAAVFTIHGFCARALREHALESGQGFDAPDLLANDRDLLRELATDLWRAHAQDPAGADDLFALWNLGPAALAADFPALLREPVLLPPAALLLPEPLLPLQAAASHLANAFRRHGDDFRMALLSALEAKVLNAGSYKQVWIDLLFAEASAWVATGDMAAPFEHPKIANLQRATLLARTNATGAGMTPDSPICAALEPYLQARVALAAWQLRRRAALLHRIRDDARARLASLKQQRRVHTYDDLIDGVADALAGPHGDVLAQRLRAQYRVALVDEFQDTDTRQWAIFDRVFGSGSAQPALFVIGDPKQAIYGFRGGDVQTYLAAGRVAERAPPLTHNFRSRPALLAAVAALYANAGETAFIDQRIMFRSVESGGTRHDAGFQRNRTTAPALTLWHAPLPPQDQQGKRKPYSAPRSRELATEACVAAIHAVLSAARTGNALIEGKPVQPGDIAVLVRSHREATMVQLALALAGIPAVAAGKHSLFATEEARELHALLLALLHSGDDGRLRTALATLLVGVDAAGIDALDSAVEPTHGQAHRAWQQRALGWRERLLRGGPLAVIGDLCAQHSPRLLGLLDGERRVSNYLQLAELLQEAQANALGLDGLMDWLGQRIATADANDETQLLRLESDARRVQIVTLHKSKGLEYPLVFLPFVGIGGKDPTPGNACIAHHDEHGRRLHWKLDLAEADWDAASTAWKQEQQAEDARLLYVGLTRAEHALWIATGAFYQHGKTPLAKMLDPQAALASAGIVFDHAQPPLQLPRLPPESDATVPAAKIARRPLANDWWVYSFSQLARADAGIETGNDTASAATLPTGGGNDEPAGTDSNDGTPESDFDARFVGNRYGVALHAALERIALAADGFGAWRAWQADDAAPADHADLIANALGNEGYGADVLDDGTALSTRLIGHTLTVALPEGVRLCDVPASDRRPEIEFQFALKPVQVDALLRLLHAHDVVRDRRGFGLRRALEGMMTGLIDLTYHHAGKWYVLDYKSNRLPTYDDASMAGAMAHSEYDLQALIYTLALHRWLRFRLGAAYDYARDFGGIRYLFCRGLDASRSDSPGIHAQRFAPELVHALDALFGQADAEGAVA